MISHWTVLISVITSVATAALLPNESLFENDQCGTGGVCKKAKECSSAMALLKEGKKPELCSFDGNDNPIVCCAEANVDYKITEETVSATMCQSYSKTLCPGFLYSILQGTAAKSKELPFMALIGYGSKIEDVLWQCGGSLISKRYVISAAHCTSKSSLGKPRWVRLGELDTKDTTEDAKPQDFRITEYFNHPDYDVAVNYNDIALYQLDRDVTFDEYVRPVCLSQTHHSAGIAIAAGWGRTDPVEQLSPKLLKVELDLLPLNNCSKLENPTQLPKGLTDDMICSGKLEGGKDTCQGDSGGPLFLPPTKEQINEECYLYTQVGITSFGKSCGLAGFPAIYTNVASFLPWIERIVWPRTNASTQSIWD